MKIGNLVEALLALPQDEEIGIHVVDQNDLCVDVGIPYFFKNKHGFNFIPDGWYLPVAYPIQRYNEPTEIETYEFTITSNPESAKKLVADALNPSSVFNKN